MISRIMTLLLIVLFSTMLVSDTNSAVKNMVENPDFMNGTEGWSIGEAYGSITIDKSEKGIVGNVLYTKVDRL